MNGGSRTDRLRFAEFELDLRTMELFRSGQRLNIAGKPLMVLAALLERPGRMVTRGELRERLWPADTFVDFDGNLNAAVRKLRKALGDEGGQPAFIETLPRRGYRFIAPLEMRRDTRFRPPRRCVAAIMVAAALGLVALPWGAARNDVWVTVTVLPFKNLSGEPAQEHIAEGLHAELSAELARHSETRVRVLIGTGGRQVWADSFTCPLQDLFGIQRQVAAKISKHLLVSLRRP
jgi:DNA-binding winged helix-turn-helix (wHTH) protein